MKPFNKQNYKNLEFSDYQWGGFTDGIHHFVKEFQHDKPPYRAYAEMNCSEECLTNGNAAYMAMHGYTYGPELIRKIQRKYKREQERAGA